jgi:hypothetical protein
MSGDSRRQAIDAYKQRPADRGVFAIRCAATQRVWVGAVPDLGAAHNAMWFMLRGGRQRNPSMQQDWKAHGETSFTFEVLERLDPEMSLDFAMDELKRQQKVWLARLGAEAILR